MFGACASGAASGSYCPFAVQALAPCCSYAREDRTHVPKDYLTIQWGRREGNRSMRFASTTALHDAVVLNFYTGQMGMGTPTIVSALYLSKKHCTLASLLLRR